MIIVIGFDSDPEPQLDVLIELLQSRFGPVTTTRLEFTPPIVSVPAWWEALPNKAKLKVVRETAIWKDTTNTVRHSTEKAGKVLDYWGKFKNGLLCVYSANNLELWVSAGDVEAV